jgi:hypothetical protein
MVYHYLAFFGTYFHLWVLDDLSKIVLIRITMDADKIGFCRYTCALPLKKSPALQSDEKKHTLVDVFTDEDLE